MLCVLSVFFWLPNTSYRIKNTKYQLLLHQQFTFLCTCLLCIGSILNGELRDFASLSQHQASPSPSLTPHRLLTSPNEGGSSSSNNHTVTSTSLMPYSCDLCTMRFGTVQGLQKHAVAVHGLMSPNNLGAGSKDHHNEAVGGTPGAGLFCVQCSLSFPSAPLFAEHYVLIHGSSSAAGGLMIPSSPAPEQLKPTDLSKKAHRHSQHHEDRSPPKRHKSSVENAQSQSVAMSDTPASASSMVWLHVCSNTYKYIN